MPHNHFITLEEAQALTKKLREKKEIMLADAFKGQEVVPTCETFDREAFDHVLGRPDCAKIRIYLGMATNHKIKLVIVGVDENGNDMLPQMEMEEPGDNKILENGFRCPTNCPPNSPLNS